MNDLGEDTNVHKEKVARREIGTLTTNKTLGRQPLFIKPNNPEKIVRYVRKPLDYSILDDIGNLLTKKNLCFSLTQFQVMVFVYLLKIINLVI